MLARLGRTLLLQKQWLYYSTQEKKNVVIVPKRHQVNFRVFNHLEAEIQTAVSCKVLSVLIKVFTFS